MATGVPVLGFGVVPSSVNAAVSHALAARIATATRAQYPSAIDLDWMPRAVLDDALWVGAPPGARAGAALDVAVYACRGLAATRDDYLCERWACVLAYARDKYSAARAETLPSVRHVLAYGDARQVAVADTGGWMRLLDLAILACCPVNEVRNIAVHGAHSLLRGMAGRVVVAVPPVEMHTRA